MLADYVVMRDPQTQRPRGLGFVTYSCIEEVVVVKCARSHRLMDVCWNQRQPCLGGAFCKAQCPSNSEENVSGIKEDTEEQNLRDYFENYGEIETIEVLEDRHSEKKRGFTFVTLNDHGTADNVV